MASSIDFVEYVVESLSGVNAEITYRKMFGDYCIYADGKPVLLVCDNTVYAKMLPLLAPVVGDALCGEPYPGAKPHYIIDIDDNALATRVVTGILL